MSTKHMCRSAFGWVVVCALLMGAHGVSARARQGADYLVGTQDVLIITVWDQPEMTGKYTVETDGTIALPMVGRVNVSGLKARDVETELKRRLADGYLRNPQLSVLVEQSRAQRVIIVGEVRNPNAYPYVPNLTLIEALAQAGSTTEQASQDAIVVRPRASAGDIGASSAALAGPQIFRVDLKRLAAGDFEHNILLRGGDTVIVSKVEIFYVMGQVRMPGKQPAHRDTTVQDALSLAGGVTDRGSEDRVRIRRIVNGKQIEIKVKLNDLVQPGDTVVVLSRIL